MTIDYGVPITNNTAYPAGKPISVVTTQGAAPSVAGVTNASGQIVLTIPVQSTGLSFTLTGVLVSLSGSGKTSLNVNVSVSPGNGVLITAGQTQAVVITSILPGIKAPTLSTGTTPGIILGTGVPVPTGGGGFSINVAENYIDMLRNTLQFNGGAAGSNTQGVQLLFTFAGIPAGVTFSSAGGAACTATITSGATVFPVGTANSTLTSTNNTLLVEIGGTATTPSLTAIDSVTVACPVATVGSTATLPLTPGAVTATVTLAPTGTAFSSAGAVLTGTTGQIPRYTATQLPSPALVVANIVSATTSMLFPYVVVSPAFDTGFAIANTSGDPFGSANGGARAQNGTVAMYFFPVTPASGTATAFCVTTGGTATNPVAGGTGSTPCTVMSTLKGSGISTGGVVNAGSTWVVLGSEILSSATGLPTSFTGYVFGVANFTNAHPTSFVADAAFSGKFTSGGPALVLATPNTSTARAGAGSLESLSH